MRAKEESKGFVMDEGFKAINEMTEKEFLSQ